MFSITLDVNTYRWKIAGDDLNGSGVATGFTQLIGQLFAPMVKHHQFEVAQGKKDFRIRYNGIAKPEFKNGDAFDMQTKIEGTTLIDIKNYFSRLLAQNYDGGHKLEINIDRI